MAEDISDRLLSLVKEDGLGDDLQYEEVVAEFKRSNTPVVQLLQDFGIMSLDDVLQVMAHHLGTNVVSVRDREFAPDLLKTIPANVARMYQCLPVGADNGTLQIAIADPLDPARADEIQFAVKREVQVVVADPTEISKAIERLYGTETEGFSEILKELGSDEEIAREAAEAATSDRATEDAANAAPIVKFVNLVLFQTIQTRASDIHFEPFETEFRIRYRVDGALYEMSPPPKHLALPVISRIKVMSGLNISEKRLPQDGRIKFRAGSREIDLRVSTLPTQFGESVVLRVLDRAAVNLDIAALGFPKYVNDYVVEAIQRPNGIFVVTGPTGSGKTTTLYSCLREVNSIDSKLLPAEAHVKYDIDGTIQGAVTEAPG